MNMQGNVHFLVGEHEYQIASSSLSWHAAADTMLSLTLDRAFALNFRMPT